MTTKESREQVYAESEMTGNQLGFGDNPAVIVIDIQNGMTDPENPLGSELNGMVEAAGHVIDAAHDADVPVIFTRAITHDENALDMGVFAEKIPALKTLQPDSEWVEIDDRITVGPDDYVLDKQQQSAFHGTQLHPILTSMGVDTLLVLGCSTSGCVRATVFDAVANGFRTALPAEAVGDRSDYQHEANLFEMGAKNADVVSLEEAIEYLESRP